MDWIKSFFENTPGRGSSGRLIFIIGSLWSMAFVTVAIIMKYCSWIDGMEKFVEVWAVLHAAKTGSKHFETRNNTAP
jgi:hypothetical protein